MENKKVLEVNQLKTTFSTDDGEVTAVDGVSFSIGASETLGIVGESGSGKSVTSLSIMGLVQKPQGKLEGSIIYKGKEIINLPEKKMYKVRGNEISMIFQEPMTSLNPVYTIGNQLVEGISLHMGLTKKESNSLAIKMLELVGIPRAKEIMKEYPHSLSGGMRQRVMIAMAMSCNPSVLIADEPTTALDVTIQAQILDLMQKLKDDYNTAILMVTHDLGVVAEMCDRVIVMYGGRVVEEADVKTLFHQSKHPYTKGLMKSTPKLTDNLTKLYTIPGNVPSLKNMPKGCAFAPRCEYAFDKCHEQKPELVDIGDGHKVSCWLVDEEMIESKDGAICQK